MKTSSFFTNMGVGGRANMKYMECRHIKSNGCKCEAVALSGLPYCYFHMRLHRARHCKNGEPNASNPIDMPVIEDRTDVQFALTQVLQGLGAKRLKPRDARTFLYGLQIAAQLVDRSKHLRATDFVQDLTTNAEGEEMGPGKVICEDDEDCDDCPFSDNCPHCVPVDDDDDEEEGD